MWGFLCVFFRVAVQVFLGGGDLEGLDCQVEQDVEELEAKVESLVPASTQGYVHSVCILCKCGKNAK